MGLLDDLKQQADAVKKQDVDRTESMRASAVAVDHALRRMFLYLNDLGKQVNVVQMPSSFSYELPATGRIDGLVLKDFFVDFRSKHFIDRDYYGELQVNYRCASDRQMTVKKGPEDMEKFRDLLWQSNIEHKSEQFRNERKVISHEIFVLKCELRVQAKIDGDHESGKLKIVTKNVGALEMDIFTILATEMNDQAVEEFAKYFIGRPNQWVELVKRSALSRPAAPAAARPRTEPRYQGAKKAPEPDPQADERRGLFGSLKSLIRKE